MKRDHLFLWRNIAILLLIALVWSSALATAQYRCNGRVYTSPCLQKIPQSSELKNLLITNYGSNPSKSKNIRFAAIKKSELELKSSLEGIWRGVVEGNGLIHLHLRILRKGRIESLKYMGNVLLKNKSTTFAFKSMLPKGKNWSWDVIAKAQ